ncbi:hypothetical protein G9464_17245 [Halostella sp. JP-L12]|uniref:hypothetical protein n=1 Tax=Halostella TaxID=1843185 RepID=UPI000EF81364|nr:MULTISPECIES: hypothetical protein [Halostella]NHN49320.1 hypothetical protein [Halostella sp. JP-L12]
MTDAKGNGSVSPAIFHDDTDEATVEVSAEAAAVAAQELGFTIERTGGPETSAQEACSPLAAVRQAVADNDDLTAYARGFILNTIDRVGEERKVEISNADPLTSRIFDARREFEQVLEDGDGDE